MCSLTPIERIALMLEPRYVIAAIRQPSSRRDGLVAFLPPELLARDWTGPRAFGVVHLSNLELAAQAGDREALSGFLRRITTAAEATLARALER